MLGMVAAAVALKVAVVAPDDTVTDAGTVSRRCCCESVMRSRRWGRSDLG